MPRPDYYDPQRLDEVHALLGQYGDDAKLVAGGQSLMVMLRQGLIEPTALIDLARVPGLAGIERRNGTIRVGAMTTIRTLETDATVRRVLPAPHRRTLGPFVFLDQMGPALLAPGAGIDVRPHPHIGLATVTWLLEG